MRKKPSRPAEYPSILLRLGPRDYAVAVWREDEDGEPVYEMVHRDIQEVMVVATLARKERESQ